jgi:methyl-accepting chemotaxis protein
MNETVYALVELASFKPIEKYKIEFLEKVGQSIAASISNIKTNHQTKQLLLQSQQHTEELRAQEEEMRQNMEELTATQEELSRKSLEIEQIRMEEKKKAEQQIESQKKIMEQFMNLSKAKEQKLKDKIAELETKLSILNNDNGMNLN